MNPPRPMKALVIGSEGNIGAPLVAYLRSVGHEVLECDQRPGWRPNYLTADITHPHDAAVVTDAHDDVGKLLRIREPSCGIDRQLKRVAR